MVAKRGKVHIVVPETYPGIPNVFIPATQTRVRNKCGTAIENAIWAAQFEEGFAERMCPACVRQV